MSAPSRKNWPSLLVIFLLILAIQLIGASVTFPNIRPWYENLAKPSWTPPNGTFGPVWTLLYLVLTVVGWRLWRAFDGSLPQRLRQPALALFWTQMLLNCLWSPLFFGWHLLVPAFVDICLMLVFTVLTIAATYRIQRRLPWLLVPYLLWILYAACLNGAIVLMN